MKTDEALKFLAAHSELGVREATRIVQEARDRRTRIINIVQEAVQQLQLDVKYLVFDLEATRRERDELRKA